MIENHHDKWFSMSPWNAFFTIIPLFPTFFSLKNSMTNSTDTTAEWYVLRVTYQRELSTKEYLDKLNIENFVPIRVVRRRNSKGQFFRACEAAVHNYIFIRSTRGVIDELKTYKLPMLRYVMHPQNGENQIMVVPEEQIIIGNTAFGSTPVAPGHVKHTGTGVTNMGSLKAPMAKVEEMAEGLRAAGLEVQVHENVMNAIWHKLLANVAINGMSALLETKNGFVDGNQYAHEAARMLVEEASVVANAGGCTLDHDAEVEHAYEVSRMTDETISSMVQDVTHHRETEIRIITGAVCRLGREHGIPTPCNDLMLQLVLAKQSIYLGR